MSVMDSIKKSGHSTPEMPCIIEPKQYKEMIKTIRAGTHESFDKKVNELLSEGWTVKNAYIFINDSGNGSYCAILSKFYEAKNENGEDVQTQKQAKWISYGRDNDWMKYYRCSSCSSEIADIGGLAKVKETYRFCPQCGARMDGDNDGKD